MDAKKETKIHLGPLPGRRKEIYVRREACVIFHVLSVSIREQRACLLLIPHGDMRSWAPGCVLSILSGL